MTPPLREACRIRRRVRLILLLGLLVAAAGLAAAAIVEASVSTKDALFGPVDWRGPTSRRVVALTFDDGPDPRWTPRIIHELRAAQVPATFFLEGANVQAHPGLAREELEAGDEIGDHSWDHRDFIWLGPEAIDRELDRTQRIIYRATGERPRLFRPPYGRRNIFVWPAARARRLTLVEWSLSPWRGRSPRPTDLVERTLHHCRPGDIILLHDGRGNRGQTVEALPDIIARLKARGYGFVTVSQLYHPLSHSRRVPTLHQTYSGRDCFGSGDTRNP